MKIHRRSSGCRWPARTSVRRLCRRCSAIAQYGNIGFYPVYLMIFAVLMIVLVWAVYEGAGKEGVRKLGSASEGVRGGKPPACDSVPSMAARNPFPGLDVPTSARIGTCRPMGRSHFSFDGERKVCKRKPAARHYGKKASTAHFDGGARNVARDLVGQITPTLVRAPVLAFFRRQNGRAFFPSLPNAALLPPQLALGILKKVQVADASLRLGWACSAKAEERK